MYSDEEEESAYLAPAARDVGSEPDRFPTPGVCVCVCVCVGGCGVGVSGWV